MTAGLAAPAWRIFHVTDVWPGTECHMHKTGDRKRRNGHGLTTTAELGAQSLSPLLSPRLSCCSKGEKGYPMWEGLSGMNQMLLSLVPSARLSHGG